VHGLSVDVLVVISPTTLGRLVRTDRHPAPVSPRPLPARPVPEPSTPVSQCTRGAIVAPGPKSVRGHAFALDPPPTFPNNGDPKVGHDP
jgi:hypothetical protein